MAAQSREQKETVERVMHEFKHGELETGAGAKVKNPKQAIAIGLREAGASNNESDEKNAENLKRTRQRERKGETARDAAEGAGKASGKPDKAAAAGQDKTKAELYEEAKAKDIAGRSTMSKEELAAAVQTGGKQLYQPSLPLTDAGPVACGDGLDSPGLGFAPAPGVAAGFDDLVVAGVHYKA